MIRVGDIVAVKKGATVRSSHPHIEERVQQRARRVIVRGITDRGDGGRDISWAGSSAYWHWTDEKSVELIKGRP